MKGVYVIDGDIKLMYVVQPAQESAWCGCLLRLHAVATAPITAVSGITFAVRVRCKPEERVRGPVVWKRQP